MITVGSIRSHYAEELHYPFVYVGRYNKYYGLLASPFANPFLLRAETKEERLNCILQFSEYWYSAKSKGLREKAILTIPNGSQLLCWCHEYDERNPKLCHADVIAGYLNAKHRGAL